MIKLEIVPFRIWPFAPSRGVPITLVSHLKQHGWGNVPRVPVFEIPETLRGNYEYLLIDGHNRREAAIHLGHSLPVCIYGEDEEVDVCGHLLAPFRHHSDSNIYYRLLQYYLISSSL